MSDWIDDLERKAKAATPGPWYAWDRGVGWLIALDPDGDVRLPEGMRTDLGRREDAEFIAAADPDTILRLIEDNRRMRHGSLCPECNAKAWGERADFRRERDELAAKVAAVEALADEWDKSDETHEWVLAADLRAALTGKENDQ